MRGIPGAVMTQKIASPNRGQSVVANVFATNSIRIGAVTRGARAAMGATLGRLPLTLHLHLLPYPGSGSAGHVLIKETLFRG